MTTWASRSWFLGEFYNFNSWNMFLIILYTLYQLLLWYLFSTKIMRWYMKKTTSINCVNENVQLEYKSRNISHYVSSTLIFLKNPNCTFHTMHLHFRLFHPSVEFPHWGGGVESGISWCGDCNPRLRWISGWKRLRGKSNMR